MYINIYTLLTLLMLLIYIYIYIHIHLYLYTYIYMHTYIHICTHTHTHKQEEGLSDIDDDELDDYITKGMPRTKIFSYVNNNVLRQ
jgi:hypothetical protein